MTTHVPYETELKFRVHPEFLKETLHKYGVQRVLHIKQGYICQDETSKAVCRIRQQNEEYILCIKTPIPGKISVVEVETVLTPEQFKVLWPSAKNCLEKTRYEVNIGAQLFTFDVFKGKLEGLVLAEIELDTKDPCTEEDAYAIVKARDTTGFLNSPSHCIAYVSGPLYANVNLGAMSSEDAQHLINQ